MSRAMTRPDGWPPSTGSPEPTVDRATGRAATRAAPLVLAVDRPCDGYGMCAELLPELIDLDDWGYPMVRPGAVPADLRGLARRAVDAVPGPRPVAPDGPTAPLTAHWPRSSRARTTHERDHRAIRAKASGMEEKVPTVRRYYLDLRAIVHEGYRARCSRTRRRRGPRFLARRPGARGSGSS